MANWKLILSYNGEHFHGWQVQPGLVTVQGKLAEALYRITGETILPQGAGRTDAGVHALAQVASFSSDVAIPPANLQRALNRVLPSAVRVILAEHAPAGFHARHAARRKLYEYRLFEARGNGADETVRERLCSPFLAPFVWNCPWPLCEDWLQAAAAELLGTQDFSAMAAANRAVPEDEVGVDAGRMNTRPNPVKTIYSSAWHRVDGLLVYRVCGSGFLHHMVRNLVGTMVDIGRGSTKLEHLKQILDSRDRSQAGPTAPASGLFLVEVGYENANQLPDSVDARVKSVMPQAEGIACA
ncbi:MAG: tRNA pseudouridine(38-40) synthase TruA [Janthinobacterium lividum]